MSTRGDSSHDNLMTHKGGHNLTRAISAISLEYFPLTQNVEDALGNVAEKPQINVGDHFEGERSVDLRKNLVLKPKKCAHFDLYLNTQRLVQLEKLSRVPRHSRVYRVVKGFWGVSGLG